MNTATAPARMAVIEITITISTSVTPCTRRASVKRIGRIARAVSIQNDRDTGRAGDRDIDEQRLRGRNGAQAASNVSITA